MKIKIKLTVADRVYPLTISSDQEASLRISAKKIEEMTKQLEQNYAAVSYTHLRAHET